MIYDDNPLVKKALFLLVFALVSCLSQDLIQLASEYSGNITFFEQTERDLRLGYAQCNYETECFEREGLKYIKEKHCYQFQNYDFVSEVECIQAGQGVINLILSEKFVKPERKNLTETEKVELFNYCKNKQCYLRTLPTKEDLDYCKAKGCYTIYDQDIQYTKELRAIEEYNQINERKEILNNIDEREREKREKNRIVRKVERNMEQQREYERQGLEFRRQAEQQQQCNRLYT